jgi:hypothetical protein
MMHLALLVLVCSFAHATPTSPDALRQLYADYNTALLNKDGPKAAAFLHSNIVNVYGEALQLAKAATKDQLQGVPAHQKLIALYLRAAAAREDIAAMNEAPDVVAFMVRKGALRSDAQMSTDLRDFTFQGDEAFASLYASGRNTNLRLRFAKEAGAWKIDLTDFNRMADDVYAQTAQLQKVSIDEALVRLIGSATGKPVADDIWIPLNAAIEKSAASN